jgi:hypothetical protein
MRNSRRLASRRERTKARPKSFTLRRLRQVRSPLNSGHDNARLKPRMLSRALAVIHITYGEVFVIYTARNFVH